MCMIICNIVRMLTWFLYIVVFKTMYSHFRDYTFGCNAKVQYIKQNVQYNALPKIHHFSYIKCHSIPKTTQFLLQKWGLHTNIEYNTMKYHVHMLNRVSSYYMQSYLLIFLFDQLAQNQCAIHNQYNATIHLGQTMLIYYY